MSSAIVCDALDLRLVGLDSLVNDDSCW